MAPTKHKKRKAVRGRWLCPYLWASHIWRIKMIRGAIAWNPLKIAQPSGSYFRTQMESIFLIEPSSINTALVIAEIKMRQPYASRKQN